MRNKGFVHLRVMILLTVSAACIFAQTAGTGAITGSVTDATGAVIPNVTVVAMNPETGQQRTVTTGADGVYNFALLPPGTYRLRFTANGFKTGEVAGINVSVTETPVLNEKLEVGTQAEQVTVEANAEAIQTANAALGTVVGGQQVTALPLTSRNYTNILALSAGVAAGVTNASALGKAGMDMAVNGAGTGQNNVQIDGANVSTFTGQNSNQDQFNTYGVTPVPNPDALQEFKVQTSSYDAGYGRNAGANVNAVTKSGTNTFHGTLFEFIRNTDLNANDYFLNLQGKARGVLNQNQFGLTTGGPIKKDKLFFFASYQGTRQKNGMSSFGNTSLTLPPIPSGPRENTAGFTNALGAAFCPANHPGTQFATQRGGVQVACDGSNISPVAVKLLQAKLPDGTYAFLGSGTSAFANANIVRPATYSEDQGLANGDYIISDRHTLAVRFFTASAPATISFQGTAKVPGFDVPTEYRNTTGIVKLTSVLTPSTVNEFRLSINRGIANFLGNNSGFNDQQFGITPLSPYQDSTVPGFMSAMIITGAYTVAGSSNGNDFSNSSSTAYTIADQVSLTRGRHTIRTGFELEQVRWTWNFYGLGAGNLNIPTFADFLIGRPGCAPGDTACTPSTPTLTNGVPNNGTAFSNIASTSSADALGPAGNPHSFRIPDYMGFVNDDIKLTSRLTVNLGVRYEFFGMPADDHGVLTNVWPSAISKVPVPGSTPATGTWAGWVVPANSTFALLPGMTRASNNNTLESGPSKNNFAPRFGFAWQPLGGTKFVVRGGYGIFFDRVPGANFAFGINNSAPQAPSVGVAGVANYYSSLAVPFQGTTGTFPVRWVDFSTAASSNIPQQIFQSNWLTPALQSYNLGVQYNFLPSWILEVGYVGSHGTHLSTGANQDIASTADLASATHPVNGVTTNTVANAVLRLPYLGFSSLRDQCTCFDSRFNSLQATIRRQFSHGFQAQAAYTWARAFSDAGANSPAALSQNYRFPKDNWGLDSNYHPHRLVISYGWNIPSGKMTGVVGKLVSGWSLSGVTTIQDGAPLTVTDSRGGTIYGNLSPSGANSRAELAPGVTYANIPTSGDLTSRLGGLAGGQGYFNKAAFLPMTCTLAAGVPTTGSVCAIAPDGSYTNGTPWGNEGIGVLLGPGQLNFDAALMKSTRVGGIHEDAALQFRAEFFNLMNHAQFSNPAVTFNTATFGQITSTTVNPRLIQFALKYVF